MMIKSLIVLLFTAAWCCPLAAEYVKGDLLFRNNFNRPNSLTGWTPDIANAFEPTGGLNGKGAIHLKDHQLISYELDPKKFTGSIIFEVVYKGSGIKEPEKPYWGAKAMLVIERKDKKITWSEPVKMNRHGTFDWQLAQKIELIPEDTQKLTIRLGLENATGDYRCDQVSIYRCHKTASPIKQALPLNQVKKHWQGGNYRGFMSGNDLSETAFQTLAKWNVNLLRYQMRSGKRDISTPDKYLAWINDEIVKLDQVLVLCKKYGIKVVIDLHSGPSGSRRNAVASNIITDPEAVLSQLKEAWKIMARHYQGNPSVYGYDILNEPQTEDFTQNKKSAWPRISTAIVKTIRAIDREMPIIIEPDLSEVRTLHYIAAPNIIYSVHAYAPIEYTHQYVMDNKMIEWSYPGEIQGVKWDRAQLRADLQPIRDFQLKHKVPIFVGEFSTIAWAPGREQYLADLIDIFEEFGWDWTYHAFREWSGWSLECTADKPMTFRPSADNPALRTVLDVLKKNPKIKPVE